MTGALAPLPWQRELWQRTLAAHESGRLAQAILLGGPRGTGKRHFAIALAARLACEKPGAQACGQCRSCTQLAAGSHPNLTFLTLDGHYCLAATPDGRAEQAIPLWMPDKDSKRREIAADGVRDLLGRLTLSTHYGGARVAVIDPADGLSHASSNALLKTFEEPPAGTTLILVAESWRLLPATLRSRCRILKFSPPPRDAALAWLKTQFPQARPEALGAVARAPTAAAPALEPEAAARRRDWEKGFVELAAGRPQALKLAERIKREEAQEMLEWLLFAATGWLRRSAGGAAAEAGAPSASPRALLALLADASEGLRALDRNGNPALVTESIMIRWSHRAQGRG